MTIEDSIKRLRELAAGPSLESRIMNLPARLDSRDAGAYANGYKQGHRDARHAAAEIALACCPEVLAHLLSALDEREALLEALVAIEPFIPKTSAADGGAAKYSAAVAAADKVRAAIDAARKETP